MLHEGQDDVLDFLGTGLMSSVTSTQGSRKNKDRKSSDKKNTRFNTSEDGKLVFEESGDEQAAEPLAPQQEDFYKQSLRGEAAFVRTADGKIKFLDGNQSAKKRGRDTEEETGGRDAGTDWRKRNYNKKAKNSESSVAVGRMLGQQYRSSKARGDVKKAGMADPHAYIPLSGKIVGNKRKSAQTTGAFKNVIRAAKEGGPVKESSGNGNGANKRNTTIKRGNKKHNK